MRGLVFNELLELVENKFGYEVVDGLIEKSHLQNDGAYSAVGNYPFEELQRLVINLSEHSKIPIPALLEVFGEHLFPKLLRMFPMFVEGKTDVVDFLTTVEDYIHVEVRKLYPDAELPTFAIQTKKDAYIELLYDSERKLHDFAKGLIKGAAAYFEQNVEITCKETDNEKVLICVKVL